ncbi:hypothetical protein Tco_1534053 [Tanacetum coccineum]
MLTDLVNFSDMAPLPAADQRHSWLKYQIQEYIEEIRRSYEQRLETIWSRPVNRVHVLYFEGLTPEMRQDLAVRLRMVYSREGQQVMSDIEMGFDVADTLCFQLGGVRRRMTWRQFILALGLHTEQEMAEAGFGAYWDGSDRLIPDKGDLRDYWIKISSDRDFLGPAPSYVLIRDPVRRSCHRMIAYNISGRGQALEKYLFRHMEGRKSGAKLSGGHFIGRLAMHFGLVSDEGLTGLQVVTRELPLIDVHELGRLNIYTRYGDTWAWVAQGPERQQAAAAGAHEADKAGPAAEEGAQEIPVPTPAPTKAPPSAPQHRTMSQRIERVEEEVHELWRDVVGLRGVVESFTTEQSRVSTWLITCMTQLMDASGQTYQPFHSTLVGGLRLSF